MEQGNSNTNLRKGKHLTKEERELIQTLYNQGKSITEIARALCRSYNTIKNELKRGQKLKYNGKQVGYEAETAQDDYDFNKENRKRHYKLFKNKKFLTFIYIHMRQGWSIEVCVERAVKEGLFKREEIVCTKTLYNMIAKGLLDIKSCDLPEKMQRRKNKKRAHHPRPNLRKMGRSIEERDKAVFERKEIGHWELDTVRGARGGKDTLVTFIERKTRFLIVLRVHSSKSNVVVGAIRDYINSFGALKSKIFKTITTDNGSEF